jgi:hypothetical protein
MGQLSYFMRGAVVATFKAHYWRYARMQALSKRRKKAETRDADIDISVKRFAEEFRADHLDRLQAAGISKNRLKQLQSALGFVQINTLTPAPTVVMYSIDGLDVVATSLIEGFTATWYIDTTGQLVRAVCLVPIHAHMHARGDDHAVLCMFYVCFV